MTDKERVIDYYNTLCSNLNDNGFRIKGDLGGQPYAIEYSVDQSSPDLTMMSIADDKEAYNFLEKNNLLRKDLCQFCGRHPIDGKWTFTHTSHMIKLNICSNCHPEGKTSGAVGNSGCLLIMILPIVLSVTITFFCL